MACTRCSIGSGRQKARESPPRGREKGENQWKSGSGSGSEEPATSHPNRPPSEPAAAHSKRSNGVSPLRRAARFRWPTPRADGPAPSLWRVRSAPETKGAPSVCRIRCVIRCDSGWASRRREEGICKGHARPGLVPSGAVCNISTFRLRGQRERDVFIHAMLGGLSGLLKPTLNRPKSNKCGERRKYCSSAMLGVGSQCGNAGGGGG